MQEKLLSSLFEEEVDRRRRADSALWAEYIVFGENLDSVRMRSDNDLVVMPMLVADQVWRWFTQQGAALNPGELFAYAHGSVEGPERKSP